MRILQLLLVVIIISCNANSDNDTKNINDNKVENKIKQIEVRTSNIRILNKIPHDPMAYTQGLVYHKGFLYESTGHRGASSLRKIDPKTGEILKKASVPGRFFSEGICIYEDLIYMITWTSGKCFVYNIDSFEMIKEMNYNGEGWGLANYGKKLLMSDGSNVLRVIDPNNFLVEKNISVVDKNYNPISYLNEMENINGEIWVNIWMQDKIARINAETGTLIGWVDITSIREFVENRTQEVSNGIAYNKENEIIYLTGKNWEYIFVVQLVEL